MKTKPYSLKAISRLLLILSIVIVTQSCYHYRVLSTVSDPATEYQHKVMWSYCWGLINKPQFYVVPNCDNSGLDEVRYTTTFGNAFLTIVTLGIVCPVSVEWKCHKPCQRVGDI